MYYLNIKIRSSQVQGNSKKKKTIQYRIQTFGKIFRWGYCKERWITFPFLWVQSLYVALQPQDRGSVSTAQVSASTTFYFWGSPWPPAPGWPCSRLTRLPLSHPHHKCTRQQMLSEPLVLQSTQEKKAVLWDILTMGPMQMRVLPKKLLVQGQHVTFLHPQGSQEDPSHLTSLPTESSTEIQASHLISPTVMPMS